jgi:hypothetical protein
MHYSFPQNMVDTWQGLPEYKKLLETLRETGVDVEHIIEHLRELLGLHHL